MLLHNMAKLLHNYQLKYKRTTAVLLNYFLLRPH